MARLKPSRLRIRPVIFALLLAMFGLALMAPPVMAEDAPINNICPDNSEPLDDYPWADYADGLPSREGTGPCFMFTQIAYWLVDTGLIETSEDSRAQSTESGNRERYTADGTEDLTNLK